MKKEKKTNTIKDDLGIKRVIHSNNVCTIIWEDDKKTQSKCSENDVYSKEAGFLIAFLKRFMTTDDLMEMMEECVWSVPKQEETKQKDVEATCRFVTFDELEKLLGVDFGYFYEDYSKEEKNEDKDELDLMLELFCLL